MSPIAPSPTAPTARPFFKLGNPNVKSTIRVEPHLKKADPNGKCAGFKSIAETAAPPPPRPNRSFLPSPSLSPPPSQERRPSAPTTAGGKVIKRRKALPTMLLPMKRPKPSCR
ncbi:hypothetical protein CKAH01_12079 [Colletotrichum kahawae]|uniref:Uncharacterized protein n=1 Tax=Colletotrichum kahawae TaxID=34407 RepID=A0AAD9YS16_COLKA|nr:hypothetical protein CKAH01_12079 [Colletotrichum kahawae]